MLVVEAFSAKEYKSTTNLKYVEVNIPALFPLKASNDVSTTETVTNIYSNKLDVANSVVSRNSLKIPVTGLLPKTIKKGHPFILLSSDGDPYNGVLITKYLTTNPETNAIASYSEAPSSPGNAGTIYYNTTDKTTYIDNGTDWQGLGGGSSMTLEQVINLIMSGPEYRLVKQTDINNWNAKQNALGFTPENITNKGSVNGYAALDATGRVPSNQLPSFVDDVLEYTSIETFPATGEDGKIYISIASNITYRWSGSVYVPIGSDLALGETSSTAYRGDRGKVAYDHTFSTSNPHGVTKEQVGLGEVTNESKATLFTSPVFTGTPTAPTPALTSNNNEIATTEFVKKIGTDVHPDYTVIYSSEDNKLYIGNYDANFEVFTKLLSLPPTGTKLCILFYVDMTELYELEYPEIYAEDGTKFIVVKSSAVEDIVYNNFPMSFLNIEMGVCSQENNWLFGKKVGYISSDLIPMFVMNEFVDYSISKSKHLTDVHRDYWLKYFEEDDKFYIGTYDYYKTIFTKIPAIPELGTKIGIFIEEYGPLGPDNVYVQIKDEKLYAEDGKYITLMRAGYNRDYNYTIIENSSINVEIAVGRYSEKTVGYVTSSFISKNTMNDYSKLYSPMFTGTPTAPTPALTSNNDEIATTEFVKASTSQLYEKLIIYYHRVDSKFICEKYDPIEDMWVKIPTVPSPGTKYTVDFYVKTHGYNGEDIFTEDNTVFQVYDIYNDPFTLNPNVNIVCNIEFSTDNSVTVANFTSLVFISDIATTESPNFNGTPTAPTPPPESNNNTIATTEFIKTAISSISKESNIYPFLLVGYEDPNYICMTMDENFETAPLSYTPEVGSKYTLIFINNTPVDFIEQNITTLNDSFNIVRPTVPIPEAQFKIGPQQIGIYNVEFFGNEPRKAMITSLIKDANIPAPLASPEFTGIPKAPTASVETNSTQIATTAFVKSVLGSIGGSNIYPLLTMGYDTDTSSYMGMNVDDNMDISPMQNVPAKGDKYTVIFMNGPVEFIDQDINTLNGSFKFSRISPPQPSMAFKIAPLQYGIYNVEFAYDEPRTAVVTSILRDAISPAPLNSPIFTGEPLVPTVNVGTNTDQIASTKFVNNSISTNNNNFHSKSQDVVLPSTKKLSFNGNAFIQYNSTTKSIDFIFS